VLADEVNNAVEEAEKAADEAVQTALTTLLSDTIDGNKSNSSAILGSVTLNVLGQPLQVTAASAANVDENKTLEVELPSGTVSVPGNTLSSSLQRQALMWSSWQHRRPARQAT